MILSFAEKCVVKLINYPKKVEYFLNSEGIIHHEIKNSHSSHNIELEFKKGSTPQIIQKLHPNACVTSKGFAFHDTNNNLVYTDYCFDKVVKLIADSDIEPNFLWDILFDHIKIYLLKNKTVTLHAAGLEKNNSANLFFGWDGTGKSSILIDSIQNDCRFLGDDRIFLSPNGLVLPLFSSIKQFHHELLNYPKLLTQTSFTQRVFIRLSQELENIPNRFKLFKKLGSLLLKIFRKYKWNYIVIKANTYGNLSNSSFELNKIFFINKGSNNTTKEIDFTSRIRSLASNIVYADTEMIKRYNSALFSGEINSIECIEKMNEHIFNILHKSLSKLKFEIINIKEDTKINRNLWES